MITKEASNVIEKALLDTQCEDESNKQKIEKQDKEKNQINQKIVSEDSSEESPQQKIKKIKKNINKQKHQV